jgi:hypothetical protein
METSVERTIVLFPILGLAFPLLSAGRAAQNDLRSKEVDASLSGLVADQEPGAAVLISEQGVTDLRIMLI